LRSALDGAEALEYAAEALTVADRAVRAVLAFGRYQRFSGLGETALLRHATAVTGRLAERFASTDQRNDFLEMHADSCRVYASMLRMRSNLEEALAYYRKAKSLYSETHHLLGFAHCLRSFGDIERVSAKSKRAFQWYGRAIRFYDLVIEELEPKDQTNPTYRDARRGKANCIERQAEVMRAQNNKESMSKFRESLDIYREINDFIGQGFCDKGSADIYSRKRDHQTEARCKYFQACELFERAGYLLGTADCHYSLGDLSLRWATVQKDYDDALTEYKAAELLYEKVKSRHGLANCHYSFGDLALAQGDFDAAGAWYEKAIALYETVGSKLGPANCYQGLSEIKSQSVDNGESKKLQTCARSSAYEAFIGLDPNKRQPGFHFQTADGRWTCKRWRR